MTWEWSHSGEAYQNARQQLEALPRETRNVIAAEWLAAIPHPRHGIDFHAELDTRKYYRALVRVAKWSDEEINEFIWSGAQREENKVQIGMEGLRNCTNGGWKAWCCPFGCECHMVPFDPVEGSEEDEPTPQDCTC